MMNEAFAETLSALSCGTRNLHSEDFFNAERCIK